MWSEGTLDGYRFQVKHYDEGSEFGINGGRISKLWVGKDGLTAFNYDRGWDMEPETETDKAILARLIEKYN